MRHLFGALMLAVLAAPAFAATPGRPPYFRFTAAGGGTPPPPPPSGGVPLDCPAPGPAGVLYVLAGSSGNGTSSNPFGTVQQAVNAAAQGQVIHVAEGSYSETLMINNKALSLCGGYSVDFSTWNPAAHVTSLVGPGAGTAVVTFTYYPAPPASSTATLNGFQVTGGGPGVEVHGINTVLAGNVIEGNQTAAGGAYGGGIKGDTWPYVPRLVVAGNIIRNNNASSGGGGFVVNVDDLLVDGNLFDGNGVNGGVGDGGGLLIEGGTNVRITRNTFKANSTAMTGGVGIGGAVAVWGATAHFSYNTYTGNVANKHTAGVFADEGSALTFDHETFYSNVGGCSNVGGGALGADYNDGSGKHSTMDVRNSVFVDNGCAGHPGGGVLLRTGGDVTVTDSIFWNNRGTDFGMAGGNSTVTVSYSVYQSSSTGTPATFGPGDLKGVDPLFADAAGHDYHLQSQYGRWDPAAAAWATDAVTSPAIDAADPVSDFSQEPVPNGGRADMGAHGGTAEASKSSH